MAIHKSDQQEIYADQLKELLSDVVDLLNEAKADGIIFQFQMGTDQTGIYKLVSLTATTPFIEPPHPAANANG
jgi:hypothetical protein